MKKIHDKPIHYLVNNSLQKTQWILLLFLLSGLTSQEDLEYELK